MKRKLFSTALLFPMVFATSLIGVACNDGPMEEAGENIDDGIDNTKDAFEDVGDDIEDGIDEIDDGTNR